MATDQYHFFGDIAALDQKNDPLVRLSGLIDFERFRSELEAAVRPVNPKGKGGRPRLDPVMMFKILVLQRIYNISDEQAEFQIRDRLSFHRFLGLALGDRVPDSRTIWLFREALVKAGTIDLLFQQFTQTLLDQGIITREGSLIDASFVSVPKQHNTREENALIKDGRVPSRWRDQPRVLAQRDLDARWTVKGLTAHYGYKNHVKVDRASKLIITYGVTPASTNDGKVLPVLATADDKVIHADSAYQTPGNRAFVRHHGIDGQFQVKGTRHVTLTRGQRRANRRKSRIRSRVEHVFALIKTSLGGLHLRYIGMPRIAASVALTNLLHNVIRFGQLRDRSRATA